MKLFKEQPPKVEKGNLAKVVSSLTKQHLHIASINDGIIGRLNDRERAPDYKNKNNPINSRYTTSDGILVHPDGRIKIIRDWKVITQLQEDDTIINGGRLDYQLTHRISLYKPDNAPHNLLKNPTPEQIKELSCAHFDLITEGTELSKKEYKAMADSTDKINPLWNVFVDDPKVLSEFYTYTKHKSRKKIHNKPPHNEINLLRIVIAGGTSKYVTAFPAILGNLYEGSEMQSHMTVHDRKVVGINKPQFWLGVEYAKNTTSKIKNKIIELPKLLYK